MSQQGSGEKGLETGWGKNEYREAARSLREQNSAACYRIPELETRGEEELRFPDWIPRKVV